MAPNVAAKGNRKAEATPVSNAAPEQFNPMNAMAAGADIPAELQQGMDEILQKIRTHVESNCDNVGSGFAEEARKIHYGEAEDRGIYGESTPEETQELLEEGIEIMPLPGPRRIDA